MSKLKMKNNPQVSVVIPVYNAEKYLAEAVESVLAQSHEVGELIVIDDGSTDKSGEVAKSFPSVRYCLRPNGGSGAARNQGAEMARGDLLAFLDADDLWTKNKLAVQVAAFENDPELEMAFGHARQFLSPEMEAHEMEKLRCPAGSSPGLLPGTMTIKRDAFFRVGLFETGWQVGEFIDWYAKAMERNVKSLLLPDVVLSRRLHTSNTGINRRVSRTDYARILKAALDRRRNLERP